MSDPNQPSVPPGWYPDGQGGQRWWDGTQWTEHTQPAAPQQPPQAPQAPQAPQQPSPAPGVPSSDMPTVVAPNRAAETPSAPSAPSYGQPAYPPPGQPPYGQPGFGAPQGQPPFGMPGGPTGGKGNKKVLIIVGAVVAALVLIGAVGGILLAVLSGGGPEGVAKDYVNAYLKNDYKKECDLRSSDHQKEMLDDVDASSCSDYASKMKDQSDDNDSYFQEHYGESYDSIMGDIHNDVKTTSSKVDGDKATVKMTLKQSYSGDNQKFVDDALDGDKSSTQHLVVTLVKEKGDWKVDSEDD